MPSQECVGREALGALVLLLFLSGMAVGRAPSPITLSAGSWKITLGGYVKLDLIHDFNAIGSTDFDPRAIPVDGSQGTDTQVDARETRLSLGFVGPAEGRDLKLYVEGDFFGTSNAFRLRHAYGQYGILLAGQTWTTFMDELNLPPTIDFEKALAAPLVRQGLVRVTAPLSKRTELAFGIEEPGPEIQIPAGIDGAIEKNLPDFTGRVRWTHSRGHLQVSGFLGNTRFRPTTGEPMDVTIGGVLVSGRLNCFDRDAAYVEVAYGPGLGRYRGATTARFDSTGQLKAEEVVAFTVGYERYWSSRWSSNAVVAPAWVLSDFGDPAVSNDKLNYVAVNLKYWFLLQRAWAGVEYLYGRREVRSGANGSANRIQFAVRFNILR